MDIALGLAIEAAKGAWVAYKKCKSAPEEVYDAAKVAKRVSEELVDLKKEVDEMGKVASAPKSDSTAKYEEMFTRRLKGLGHQLRKLEKMIHKYSEAWFAKRCVYVLTHGTELNELRVMIDNYYSVIEAPLKVLELAWSRGQKEADKAWQERLEQSEKAAADAMRAHQKELQEQRKLMAALITKLGEPKITAAAQSQDSSRWAEVETNLAASKKGMSQADAKTMLNRIKKTIQSMPQGGQSPRWMGQVVLVDKTNGLRATMALAYLEILKLWTLNTSGRWIFSRAESAGYAVDSFLIREAVKLKKLNVNIEPEVGVLSPSGLSRITSASNMAPKYEVSQLYKRLQQTPAGGVKYRHFTDFDHIICFDKDTQNALQKVQEIVSPSPIKASITFLPLPWPGWTPSEESVKQTVLAVKSQMRNFLINTIGWQVPSKGLAEGPYRTRQLFMAGGEEKKLALRAQIPVLLQKSQCRLIHVHFARNDLGNLVFIVGPVQNLDLAEKLVREF